MNEEEKTLNLDDVKFLLEKVYAAQQAGNHVIFRHSNYSTEVIAMQGEISEEKEWDKQLFICIITHQRSRKLHIMNAFCILKNWQVRNMIINFLLKKYSQNESALEQEPTSFLLLRRKAALAELIAMDMKKNGVHR